MNKRVLVIAAHPDDEILGCGASVAKHSQLGDIVKVVILAEGLTSRDKQRDRTVHEAELSELAEKAQIANKLLGVSSLTLYEYPDNRMDSLDRLDIVKVIEKHIEEFRPSIIYTHHCGDVNIDHQVVHYAVVTACRPVPEQSVKTLLFFETPSSTEWQPPGSGIPFAPNWFNDVSDTLDLKLKALEIYQSEMRPWPHARSICSIEHLSRWRGASIGVNAAEAFIVGRNLGF